MKTKKTVLNAIFSSLNLLISSILSLVTTRIVLMYLGSDYNGLNGTINQFLSVLMIMESGFTVAALVKLYAPFKNDNIEEIDKIISKTNKILKKVGLAMLLVGCAIAAIYALFIKTNVSYSVVLLLFIFSISSTAFNFAYTYKYRLLFQVSQNEYIIYILNIIMTIFMQVGMIIWLKTTQSIILGRLHYTLCNILFGIALGVASKIVFPKVKFNVKCDDVKIEGTKDLLIGKFVGLLYNFLTSFFLTIKSGTLMMSVYTVYNSVVSIVANFIQVFLTSPKNALGQVVNSEKQNLRKILHEYEYVVVLVSMALLSTTMALIIPFIKIYTAGISDVDYIVPLIPVLLVLTFYSQLIHIPSGQCIELSGNFRVARKIQTVALIVLAVCSALGVVFLGLIGLLLAKIFTNLILAIAEITFTHTKIVPNSINDFLKVMIPNFLLSATMTFAEYKMLLSMKINIIEFFIAGIVVVIINVTILFIFNFVFYRNDFWRILNRFLSLLKKSKVKSKH